MREKRYWEVRLDLIFLYISVIVLAVAITCSVIAGVKAFQFDKACKQHVINAQNAASPEIAIEELDIAIKYAQDTGRTEGYTCKFNINGDIKLWYMNLLVERENFASLVERGRSDEFYFVDFHNVQKNMEDIEFPSNISTYQTPILLYFGWFWIVGIVFFLLWVFMDDTIVFKIPIPKKTT